MQRMGGNPLKEYRMPNSVFRMNPLYPQPTLKGVIHNRHNENSGTNNPNTIPQVIK